MASYSSRLIARSEVAKGTIAFSFERPEGFTYRAGQAMDILVPNPPHRDSKGNQRTFTIASPPQDGNRLQIATRMTGSAFKESLADVELGTAVEISGPTGTFTLDPQSEAPVVFVTGGIGITPFRSMTHDAVARGRSRPITIIASNRDPESAPFLEEFERLAREHDFITFIPTMTQAGDDWRGERQRVGADFLRNHLGDLSGPVFYVAGPPGLVTGITAAVREAGVDPSHVRSEEFPGYGGTEKAQQSEERAMGDYIDVASADDLSPGKGMVVEAAGKQIALFNVDGTFHAIDNECTHQGGPLGEGDLSGKKVTCPWHGATYDVTTGEVLGPPAPEGVARYEVKVEDGRVKVAV